MSLEDVAIGCRSSKTKASSVWSTTSSTRRTDLKTEALIDFETAQSPTTHPSTTMKREETMNHPDTSPIKLRKNWNAPERQPPFDNSAARPDHRHQKKRKAA